MTTAAPRVALATAEDLGRLAADVRAEVIDGEIVEKEASADHSYAQASLAGRLVVPFEGRADGKPPGGWWILTEAEVEYEAHQVYRHDLAGWRHDTTPDRPTGKPVLVRPDWVCEILSPSNAGNDRIKKLRTLDRHQVPYYWLVDPLDCTLMVMRWMAGGYQAILVADAGETVRAEPFDAIELRVGALFGR